MKRLGEILTELEWISPAGLTRALATQQVIGGRIGTCLLEIEALSEERLMAGLVRQLQVPAARTRDLQRIPEEVLDLLPEEIAVQRQAIPFRMLGDDLHVALLDVHDRVLLDTLAERTEKHVVPHIANEARLFLALADGYGCGVSERFRQLVKQLEGETNGSSRNGDAEPSSAKPDEAELEPAADASPDDGLETRLLAARDRDAVAAELLRHLGQVFPRCGLFVHRRGEFRGWQGFGQSFDARLFASLKIALDEPSVLSLLARGSRYHAGPLPATSAHQRIASSWGLEQAPHSAVVVPVHVGDKLAMVLWCLPELAPEAASPPASESTVDRRLVREALRVADLAGEALRRLIARRRRQLAAEGH